MPVSVCVTTALFDILREIYLAVQRKVTIFAEHRAKLWKIIKLTSRCFASKQKEEIAQLRRELEAANKRIAELEAKLAERG